MKLFTVHRNPLNIAYKHQLCSIATLFVLLGAILVVVLPFVVIHSLYRDTWKEELLLHEQPNTKFSYKYIFRATLGNEIDEKLVTCSSFASYNALTEPYQECNGVTFLEFDKNHDQKVDEMKFSFSFDLIPTYKVTSFQLLIFLDSFVEAQCKFKLPTVIAIDKEFAEKSIHGSKMSVKGALLAKQQRALTCPYFLRGIKTHFFYNLIIDNATQTHEFSNEAIMEKLFLNPVYLKFQEETSKVTKSRTESFTMDLTVDVEEIMLRYHYTLWQIVNRIWIQYLAVFVIFYICGEKIKDYLFRNQYLAAWEVVPWKKLR
ncbi:transmembrane protein 231 [Culicoides brevitarsis]|uniref:transmembrane protein 231 n=1 Tax=Culicoides brevitarsis TaxID=469753 RepID=UPI00307C6765